MEDDFKVVILGDSRVGKTSIIRRYVSDTFDFQTSTTLGTSYARRIVDVPSVEAKIQLTIWDTVGQEQFRSLATIQYKDAAAAIMVYDVTSKKSFDSLKEWIKSVKESAPNDTIIVIAGNKADMVEREEVSQLEVINLAAAANASSCLTSAKDNTGIKEMFDEIIKGLYKTRDARREVNTSVYI